MKGLSTSPVSLFLMIILLMLAPAMHSTLYAQDQPQITDRTGTPGIPGLTQGSQKAAQADGGIQISPISAGTTATQMVENILGTGVHIDNVIYTGASTAAGSFYNGQSTGIEFESGIILSSGLAASILGPNNVGNASNYHNYPGDPDLTSIIGSSTYDASVLEFDFIPENEVLTFNYILFSEEYPEYLQYSDVFAFFLDGENIALIPGTTEPVAIGTVNHNRYADYYVSNSGGIYNVQADGFTTVFTATAQVSKGVAHHIKLAVADMGDQYYDTWVLIEGNSFSTLGSIIGHVYNRSDNEPVQDAVLTALGKTEVEAKTNISGAFQIVNLPFGYDYKLSVIAPGFDMVSFEGIDLLEGEPTKEMDIYLDPIAGNYEVVAMSPDPNPEQSEAMPAAKMVHRYYAVSNKEDGSPGIGIPVTVRLGSADRTYKSDDKGIVDIAIPESHLPDAVGDVLYGQIYKIFDTNLDNPIDFQVHIVDPVYEKYWEKKRNVDLDLLHIFAGGISSTSATRLSEQSASNTQPEKLKISMEGDAYYGGASAGVGVEAVVKVNDFTAGGSAKAGVKAKVGVDGEKGMQFSYVTQSDKEALAKYLTYSQGHLGFFDQSMIRLSTIVADYFIKNYLLDEFHDYERGGIWAEGEGDASAKIGLPLTPSFLLSAGAEAQVAAKVNTGVNIDAEGELSWYRGIGFGADASAYSNAIVNLPDSKFTRDLEDKLSFFDQDVGVNWQRGISFRISEDRIELGLIKRNVLNESGWQTDATYTIRGDDVLYYFSSIDLYGRIVDYYEGKDEVDFVMAAANPMNIVAETFEILYNLGDELASGDLMVEYATRRSDFTEEELLDIYIGLGAELGLKVSGSLGIGKKLESGRSRIVESGEWLNFRHFPQVEYNTSIPDIDMSYEDLVQGIVDDIPTYVKVLYGTYKVLNFLSPLKSAEEVLTMDLGANSYLQIDPVVVPAGVDSIYCYSWGWYGDAGSTKSSAKKGTGLAVYEAYKQAAEEIYGMKYGIGGFYQLEPGALVLNGSADLTLSYQEEEIEGLDEAKLAIYQEDKAAQRWTYIGGVVDMEENRVSAAINELGVYTIAPAMPDGEILILVDQDTIPADGISTVQITTAPLYYNNETLVEDGELFTLDLSHGFVLNEDLDESLEGIQLAAQGGVIQAEIKSLSVGARADIRMSSLSGYAEGSADLVFLDETPPGVPTLLRAEGVNTSIKLEWEAVEDEDLAGYKIYFDPDSELPPYNGVAKIQGSPSPVLMGVDSTYTLNYLFEDSTYHVTITAFDHSGNESAYSNVMTTSLQVNQYPVLLTEELVFLDMCNDQSFVGTLQASDPDEDELSYSIVSGKNANYFEVDASTGELRLKTGKILYEDQQDLLVKVTDNGPGSLSTSSIVSIRTSCEQNHPPLSQDASFLLRESDVSPMFVVGAVEASDPDAGQRIRFYLAKEDEAKGFGVDENKGEIFIQDADALVFETDGTSMLRVVAMDDGEGWLTDTSQVLVQFSPTSNQALNFDPAILVYPNPTSGKVYIAQESAKHEVFSMELYSLIGEKLLVSGDLSALTGRCELDLSAYQAGIYILKIRTGNHCNTSYIVKQ